LQKTLQTVNSDSDWIIIGQFGRVHGIRGQIRVHPFTQESEKLLAYNDWHRFENETWIPTERTEQHIAHQTLLVKIKGFETREEAMLLTNLKIAVKKEQLPHLESDEFYCFELIGMEVFNTQDVALGIIVDVLQTGANDVLVIQGSQRHLIPYLLHQVIKNVSRETRRIIVDWDENF
jgi:16S rRNA processing protein RimM